VAILAGIILTFWPARLHGFPIPILMEFSKVGKCKACTLIGRQLVLPVSFIEVFSTVLGIGAAPTIPIE
jgi:hypothetical protein